MFRLVTLFILTFSSIVQSKVEMNTPEAGTHYSWPGRFVLGDGTLAEWQRGVVFVPQNRQQPQGPTLGLTYWRYLPLKSADPTTPPVYWLMGGPDFEGEEPGAYGIYERYTRFMNELAEVIIVSQRGIGPSIPGTRCKAPDSKNELDPNWSKNVAEASANCRDFWNDRIDISGLTVSEAAADINDVRRILGHEKITLVGASFGSHWAFAVMKQYPGIVARSLLDSIEGPNHTYDSPTGKLNVLKRIAKDAEKSSELTSRIPDGGLVKAWQDSIARLDRESAEVNLTGKPFEVEKAYHMTGDTLRMLTLRTSYLRAPRSARREAMWPAGVLLVHQGNYEFAAYRASQANKPHGFWDFTAAYFQLDCGSGITPHHDRALREDPALRFMLDPSANYRAACPEWPADAGDSFRTNSVIAPPTVMVNGDWDMGTPYENAVEMLPYLKQGKLVRVVRGPHGTLQNAIDADPKFSEEIRKFIRNGSMKNIPDTVTLPVPFFYTPEEAVNIQLED